MTPDCSHGQASAFGVMLKKMLRISSTFEASSTGATPTLLDIQASGLWFILKLTLRFPGTDSSILERLCAAPRRGGLEGGLGVDL